MNSSGKFRFSKIILFLLEILFWSFNIQLFPKYSFSPLDDGIKRKFFGTLFNTYNFFALYANIDKFSHKDHKASQNKFENNSLLVRVTLEIIFYIFWSKSTVLGWIGRSGKALGFISADFGPNPTTGSPEKGNNWRAIIIIIIPACRWIVYAQTL